MYYLQRITEIPENRIQFNLKPGKFVLGRTRKANIVCLSTVCSRAHGRLHVSNDGVKIEDLGSQNGIFVNDSNKRITEITDLSVNSCIGIGCFVDKVTMNDPLYYVFSLQKRENIREYNDVIYISENEDNENPAEEAAVQMSINMDVNSQIALPVILEQRISNEEPEQINTSSAPYSGKLQSVDTLIVKLPGSSPDGCIAIELSDSDDENFRLAQSSINDALKREENEYNECCSGDQQEPFQIDSNIDTDGGHVAESQPLTQTEPIVAVSLNVENLLDPVAQISRDMVLENQIVLLLASEQNISNEETDQRNEFSEQYSGELRIPHQSLDTITFNFPECESDGRTTTELHVLDNDDFWLPQSNHHLKPEEVKICGKNAVEEFFSGDQQEPFMINRGEAGKNVAQPQKITLTIPIVTLSSNVEKSVNPVAQMSRNMVVENQIVFPVASETILPNEETEQRYEISEQYSSELRIPQQSLDTITFNFPESELDGYTTTELSVLGNGDFWFPQSNHHFKQEEEKIYGKNSLEEFFLGDKQELFMNNIDKDRENVAHPQQMLESLQESSVSNVEKSSVDPVAQMSKNQVVHNQIVLPVAFEQDLSNEKTGQSSEVNVQYSDVDTGRFNLPGSVLDNSIKAVSSLDDFFFLSKLNDQLKREEETNDGMEWNALEDFFSDVNEQEPFIIDLDSDEELNNTANYWHLNSIVSKNEMRLKPIKLEFKEEPMASDDEDDDNCFVHEEIPQHRMQGTPVFRTLAEQHPRQPELFIPVPTDYMQTLLTDDSVIQQQQFYSTPSSPAACSPQPPVLTSPSPPRYCERTSPPLLHCSVTSESKPVLANSTDPVITMKDKLETEEQPAQIPCEKKYTDEKTNNNKKKAKIQNKKNETKKEIDINQKENSASPRAVKISERRKSVSTSLAKRKYFNPYQNEIPIKRRRRTPKKLSSCEDDEDLFSKLDKIVMPSVPATVVSTTKPTGTRNKPGVIDVLNKSMKTERSDSMTAEKPSARASFGNKSHVELKKKHEKSVVCKISESRGSFLISESVPKVMTAKHDSRKLSNKETTTGHNELRKPVPLKPILKNAETSRKTGPKKKATFVTVINIREFEKAIEDVLEQHLNKPLLNQTYDNYTVNMDSTTGSISWEEAEQNTENYQLSQPIPTKPLAHPPTQTFIVPEQENREIQPSFKHAEHNINIKMDKLLFDILQWNCDWLDGREDQVLAAGKGVLVPLTPKYDSYESYVSVISRLMIVELWSKIYRSYHDKNNVTTAIAVIFDKKDRKFDEYERTTFYCRAPDIKIKKPSGYIVLIENVTSTYGVHTVFGYVASFQRGEKENQIVLGIQVAKTQTTESIVNNPNRKLKVHFIALIRSDLKLFEGVFYAQYSPILKFIMNPTLIEAPNKTEKFLLDEPVVKTQMNRKQSLTIMEMYHQCSDPRKPDIMLLEGPPGSGKSVLIANLIEQLKKGSATNRDRNLKILVCAQSNSATDIITTQLVAKKKRGFQVNVVRFGKDENMSREGKTVSLANLALVMHDSKMQQSSKTAELLHEEKCIEKILDELKAFKLSNEYQQYEQQLLKIKKLVGKLELPTDKKVQMYGSAIVQNANVVCCTLELACALRSYVNKFDVCIVDEASQCSEVLTLIPLQFKINHLILVADSKQLPATINSRIAMQHKLNVSLFKRIQENNHSIVKQLDQQYRMHPEICKFPNMYFYQNRLKSDASTLAHDFKLKPYTVFSLECCQNLTQSIGNVYNLNERNFVITLLKQMMEIVDPKKYSYAIITPFDREIRNQLLAQGIYNVKVTTIESFQGHEQDIVILSSAKTSGIGFFDNPNRLNIALTRAKYCLVLCGNFKELIGFEMWTKLLDDATERKVISYVDEDVENPIEMVLKTSKN